MRSGSGDRNCDDPDVKPPPEILFFFLRIRKRTSVKLGWQFIFFGSGSWVGKREKAPPKAQIAFPRFSLGLWCRFWETQVMGSHWAVILLVKFCALLSEPERAILNQSGQNKLNFHMLVVKTPRSENSVRLKYSKNWKLVPTDKIRRKEGKLVVHQENTVASWSAKIYFPLVSFPDSFL